MDQAKNARWKIDESPFCCLGWQWKPYQYFQPWCELPDEITELYCHAIAETMPWYKPMGPVTTPDTAIINWFPPGSSLGMHQDKSEAPAVIDAGSPIVTISLGHSAVFRLGNCWDRGKPYQDIELSSGDLLVMGGINRLAFHGVIKVLTGTGSPKLQMRESGRLSTTIRQSQEVTR